MTGTVIHTIGPLDGARCRFEIRGISSNPAKANVRSDGSLAFLGAPRFMEGNGARGERPWGHKSLGIFIGRGGPHVNRQTRHRSISSRYDSARAK